MMFIVSTISDVCMICKSLCHLHIFDEKLDYVLWHLIEAVCKEWKVLVQDPIPVVHHNEEELESSVFHVQQQFQFDSLNMIETKMSPNPNTLWRRCSKISWSVESDAADSSFSTSTEILPSSIAESRSFVTFKGAVSVLWCGRYADWKSLNSLLQFMCCNIWESTTISSNIDMKERLETGLNFFRSSLSSDVFFKPFLV